MIINKLKIDGYKNLSDCEITPVGLHALTGCNGSGKSNIFNAFQLVIKLITGSDALRDNILSGWTPSKNGSWFPFVENRKLLKPFTFEIETHIQVGKSEWLVSYFLELGKPKYQKKEFNIPIGSVKIISEKISIKEVGKSGPKRIVLSRDLKGTTTLKQERNPRKKSVFKSKETMSALQALEVREASDFSRNFPVLHRFRSSLISCVFLNIDSARIKELSVSGISSPPFTPEAGEAIDRFSLFQLISTIRQKDTVWKEFLMWTNRLINIQFINFREEDSSSSDSEKNVDHKQKALNFIFLFQNKRVLFPHELSTGELTILSILTAIFSLIDRDGGCVLIEEPETFLHPQAIIDMLVLLRSFSENSSVLFSTHSPIIINEMSPPEVTLLKKKNDDLMTTTPVSQLQEAIDSLNRGFMSFGDLLQTNFES